jgi:GAF domain-containing protein
MRLQTELSISETDVIAILRLRFGLVLSAGLAVLSIFASIANLVGGDFDALLGVVYFVGLLAALVILFSLSRNRYVSLCIHILILTVSLVALSQRVDVVFLFIGLASVVSGALFASWPIHLGIVLLFLTRMFILQDYSDGSIEFAADTITSVSVTSIVISISLAVRYFSYNARKISNTSRHQVNLLRAMAEVGRIIATILDINELFDRSVDLIRDHFSYYHVQIFLVDEKREYAELVASTGEVGKVLLGQGHKLKVGSQSVIGRVTQLGDAVVTRDTGTDIVHARNELLPDTRSELALAIVDGENIIGALDVQSVYPGAFDETEIQVLQSLANQMVIVVRNARLFKTQETNLQENKRLFLESEASLREIQRLNRQLTSSVWEDYLEGQGNLAGVTVEGDTKSDNVEWTQSMIEAGRRQRPMTSDDGNHSIAAPIILRGQVIGVVEVEPGIDVREDDTIEMVQAVASHLAISLDNARLFEEAQETAVQQQHINEIVGQYQSATTVDDLLQIALSELGETLSAHNGKIRLGSPQRPPSVEILQDDDLNQVEGEKK